MVTTVAEHKTKFTLTLTADGAPHSAAIPGTPSYTNVAIQIVNSGGGATYDLQGSLNGTDFLTIGTLVNNNQGTIATDGFLFYTKLVPMQLRLTYTSNAPGAGSVTAVVALVKPERRLPAEF